MVKSKVILSVFSVLMILTMMSGSVQAQGEPPIQRGDLPDLGQFTPRYDEDAFPTAPIVLDGGGGQKVAQVSPVDEIVFTKTPKFYFVRDFRANRYEIQVYDTIASKFLYSFKGAGTCNSGYCYLQPTTKLKNFIFSGMEGRYGWTVRARIDGEWEAGFPSLSPFKVLSKGFTSTFDSNMNKWEMVKGTWTLAKGSLKIDGLPNEYASVYHREFFTDFDYTVIMKRKNNVHNTNGVIIGGYPLPYGTAGIWNLGLYFQYTNGGSWTLYKFASGSFTQYVDYTPSSAIKPYDWNKLRIVYSYPFVDLWINGTYLGWLSLPEFQLGVVGIDMFRSTLPKEPLLVDKAVLKVIQYPPFTERDPAMQLGLNPVELATDPNLLPYLSELQDPTGTR